MNTLSKHHHVPGDDLAAAFGMSLHAGVADQARHGHGSRNSRGVNQPGCSTSDPVRAVVADKLAHMIHIGLLQAGDPLPSERSLCEVFRVARQSVRAALGILEGRLMLAISHGRRSRILGPGRLNDVDSAKTLKRLRARETSDIHQVLIVLDAEIASLSAANVKPSELEELDALVALQPDMASDPLSYMILDYEIRSLVYASCGNSLLADIAMDFYAHASPQRRQLFADPAEIARNSQRQSALVQALRARDAREVARIMNEQAEALAALPHVDGQDAAPASHAKDDIEPADTRGTPTLTRGVFWPTAALAEA